MLCQQGIIMTTFADREHAIEAHYMTRELAAFRERSRRNRRLGFRLAALFNLHGKEAWRFGVQLSGQCINDPSEESTYRRMVHELARQGLRLSDGHLRRIAVAGGAAGPGVPAATNPEQPWIEFVTTELLALFTDKPAVSAPIPQRAH
jgi:hypothetical protein